MKIAPKAVREFLAKPDKAVAGALLYGPDAGLAHERMQAIMSLLLPEDDVFARVEITEAKLRENPALLADELAAFSLTGGRRVVLLRDAGDKLTKAVEAALPMADGRNYLLVCAGELGPRSSLRQLFEAESRVAAIACYHDEAADLQGLIRQTFDQAGIACSREAMAYLTQHLGNDRGVTSRELEKIILYLGEEKHLSLETAEALVDHNREMTLDGLSMTLANGQAAAADALLTQGLREGLQPVMLLRAAQKHFQRLCQAREMIEAGKSAEEAVGALKPPVFFRNAQTMARQASEWSWKGLASALNRLSKAELACKQVAVPPALLISRAFTGISQMRRN